MHIDWWTLGLQTINALVLVWLLARFLFKPVANMVAERQRSAAALMSDAAAAKDAALGAQKQAAAQLAQIAQQHAQLLDTASTEAATLKVSLEQAAHADADRLRGAAQAEIDAMRRDAAQADADRATRFALDITARLLDRLPQEARVAGFVEGLTGELAKLPLATRAQLAADGGALRLIAPRALQADELAACRMALAQVLGRESPFQVTVDATLLAGLELEAPHVIVRNSLRNDLAHLKTELLAHDATRA